MGWVPLPQWWDGRWVWRQHGVGCRRDEWGVGRNRQSAGTAWPVMLSVGFHMGELCPEGAAVTQAIKTQQWKQPPQHTRLGCFAAIYFIGQVRPPNGARGGGGGGGILNPCGSVVLGGTCSRVRGRSGAASRRRCIWHMVYHVRCCCRCCCCCCLQT